MNDSVIEELDDTWLEEFNVLDNDYKKFYADNITFIRYHCIYINGSNEIEFIKKIKPFLGFQVSYKKKN